MKSSIRTTFCLSLLFGILHAPGDLLADDGDVSPALAQGLAIGGSLVGPILFAVNRTGVAGTDTPALIWSAVGLAAVGPSAGHAYAGEWGRAALTASGRALALGIGTLAFFGGARDHGTGDGPAWRWPVIIAAGCAYVGLVAYDIIDAPRAARRTQERRGSQSRWSPPGFLLTPTQVSFGVAATF